MTSRHTHFNLSEIIVTRKSSGNQLSISRFNTINIGQRSSNILSLLRDHHAGGGKGSWVAWVGERLKLDQVPFLKQNRRYWYQKLLYVKSKQNVT